MATITLESQSFLPFDPDGASNPVTIEFPDSTLLVEGTTVSIANITSSTTSFTLTSNSGSASDEIMDPYNRSSAPASTIAGVSGAYSYMKWVLLKTLYVNPTWYCQHLE